jgi:hypothetical protein
LERISAGFRKLGTVVDIDPTCLGDDHSVLWVVMARHTMIGIQNDLYVGNLGHGACGESLGTAFTIEVLRVWPMEEYLDELGEPLPFLPAFVRWREWGWQFPAGPSWADSSIWSNSAQSCGGPAEMGL